MRLAVLYLLAAALVPSFAQETSPYFRDCAGRQHGSVLGEGLRGYRRKLNSGPPR